MSSPLLLAYVCVAAGIFTASCIHVPAWTLAPGLLAVAASLKSRTFAPALAAVLLMLSLLGAQLFQQQETHYRSASLRLYVRAHSMETLRVVGRVRRTPELSADFWALQVDVEQVAGTPLQGVVRATVTGAAAEIPRAGDRIETYIRMRLPSNFGTEGSFDYERYLRKEGIHVLGTIKNGSLIHVVSRGGGIRSVFSEMRVRWILRIQRDFMGQRGALLRALWLDDRAGMSPETERIFLDAGVFHVIAISGFHVGIVLALGFLLLRSLVRYRTALLVLAVVLLTYYLLLEGRSSITRSFLLFLSFAFAALRYEKIPWGNALGFAALAQLALNPLELFDAGYHLTYMSTAAIVFVAGPLCKRVQLKRKVYRYALDFLVTTVCVQAVLTPYLAWTFHRVAPGALLANWIAVPVSSVLIASGLLYLPLAFLEPLLAPVIQVMISVMIRGTSLFTGLWLQSGLAPPLAAILAFYAAAAAAPVVRCLRWRILLALLAAGCLPFLLHHQPRGEGSFRVHVIDVGQGDAILLQYPDGVFDLVDGGGFWNTDALDIGESVLLPYFARMGVTRLNRVFLTHAHADHMNGLFTVLHYIPVQSVYVTRRPVGEMGFRRLCVEWLGDLKSTRAGDVFRQGNVTLSVLAPADTKRELKVANDDSLVMLAEYEGKRMLLTGDMEKETEARLVESACPRVDVIKVPHHGSRTSSTEGLLGAIRPGLAVISAGRNNWFGHPHPEVVQRYRRHHVMVYRTDCDGTIRLTIGKGEVEVESYSFR